MPKANNRCASFSISMSADQIDKLDALVEKLTAAGVAMTRSQLVAFAVRQLETNERILRLLDPARTS